MYGSQHRRACDRCHTQKLRCNRQGNKSCGRCVKGNVECVSSPSLRKGKSRARPEVEDQPLASRGDDQDYPPLRDEQDCFNQVEQPISGSDQGLRPSNLNMIDDIGNEHQLDLTALDWSPAHYEGFDVRADQTRLDFGLSLGEPPLQQGRHTLDHLLHPEPTATTSKNSTINNPTIAEDINMRLTGSSNGGSCLSNFNLSNGQTPSSATPMEFLSSDNDSSKTTRWPLLPSPLPFDSGSPQAPRSSRSATTSSESIGCGYGLERPSRLPPSTAATSPTPPSAVSLIQRLSDINVGLFQHAATIPPLLDSSQDLAESLDGQVNANNPSNASSGGLKHFRKEFAIDQTFLLSQRLIDILNELYPRFLKSSSSQDTPRTPLLSQSPLSSPHLFNNHESLPGSGNQSSAINATPSTMFFDQGSSLLILSCYIRVIDIYEKICGHVHNCISDTSVAAKSVQITLPGLTIGLFSLQSSPAMKIILILQLAEQLLDRIRHIVGLMNSTTRPGGNDSTHGSIRQGGGSMGDITDVTLQAIRLRDAEMTRKMFQVKQQLLQSGVM